MEIEDMTILPADPSDVATIREGQFLQAALDNVRYSVGPKATGRCLYCGEKLVSDLIIKAIRNGAHDGTGIPRWCDASDDPEHCCEREWEYEQKRRKINGR